MATTITTIDEYNAFEFKDGQKFKVVNATYEIKDLDGQLYVIDADGFGGKLQQEGESDMFKFALECNKIIEMTDSGIKVLVIGTGEN